MKQIKGVIFDLDGTLIDSLETYNMAFNRTVKRYKLEPISLRAMSDFLNQFLSLEELLTQLYPSLDREDKTAFMVEMKNEFIALSKDYITLKPNVREILLSLKKEGLKIGVATGRMSQGTEKWRDLRNLKIDGLIDAVVTAGETKPKPDPASVLKCTEELGLSPHECVFVGDSRADIIAGKRAGLPVIAVATGVASKEQLAGETPDYLIESLAMLSAQLQTI